MRRPGRGAIAAAVAGLVLAAGGAAWWQFSDSLVHLRKTGGFAGVDHTIVVGESGVVRVDGEGRGRLPGDRLARLRTLLDEARFATLPMTRIDPGVRDAFEYHVTYRHRTVTTNAPEQLPGLAPVIELLGGLG
jgi:hypothetical protein